MQQWDNNFLPNYVFSTKKKFLNYTLGTKNGNSVTPRR